eukprot:7656627-Karenia_brevis.AAC.1
MEHGIALRVLVPDGAFWGPGNAERDRETHVVDAAFVDDEAVVLVARTPQLLDAAIDIALDALVDIFDCLHLELNFKAGKSECLVKYRGTGAASHLNKRRQADGRLLIRVPHRDNVWLRVVQEYKHL